MQVGIVVVEIVEEQVVVEADGGEIGLDGLGSGKMYLEACKVLAVGVLVEVVFELFDVFWFLEEQ